MNLILIFIGGGIGAVLRYLLHMRIDHAVPYQFPFGILTVNILGSFIIGLVAGYVARESFSVMHIISPLVMIGILGGFTTFSTFSLETVNLIQNGRYQTAAFYIISSVVLSVAAAFLGLVLAK